MTRNNPELLTKEALDAAFIYEPDTGFLIKRKTGARIGFVQKRGNRAVSFKGGIYQEHIVIWIMMTGARPAAQIDHRDLNRQNNKWENLRAATNQQNHGNMRGKGAVMKGAHKHPQTKRLRARITVNGKSIHLGYFDTPEEAHAAYQRAAAEHFGEFARFQ